MVLARGESLINELLYLVRFVKEIDNSNLMLWLSK